MTARRSPPRLPAPRVGPIADLPRDGGAPVVSHQDEGPYAPESAPQEQRRAVLQSIEEFRPSCGIESGEPAGVAKQRKPFQDDENQRELALHGPRTGRDRPSDYRFHLV